MLSPVTEKKGILGPTSGRRPGDVTIPMWSEGKGLAIDVAITSPLLSSVKQENPCESYAQNTKHGKYDKGFVGSEYMFCAMVWETLGAINEEGEEVIRQIFRFASKRLGHEFSSFCGRSWARVSCCLQRSVAQAILTRIDGHEFRDAAPRAAPAVLPSSQGCSSGPECKSTPQEEPAASLASREKKGSKGKRQAMRGKGSLSIHAHSPSSPVVESVCK
jgi:hypothetical protein